jgi:hypothetical protein
LKIEVSSTSSKTGVAYEDGSRIRRFSEKGTGLRGEAPCQIMEAVTILKDRLKKSRYMREGVQRTPFDLKRPPHPGVLLPNRAPGARLTGRADLIAPGNSPLCLPRTTLLQSSADRAHKPNGLLLHAAMPAQPRPFREQLYRSCHAGLNFGNHRGALAGRRLGALMPQPQPILDLQKLRRNGFYGECFNLTCAFCKRAN